MVNTENEILGILKKHSPKIIEQLYVESEEKEPAKKEEVQAINEQESSNDLEKEFMAALVSLNGPGTPQAAAKKVAFEIEEAIRSFLDAVGENAGDIEDVTADVDAFLNELADELKKMDFYAEVPEGK